MWLFNRDKTISQMEQHYYQTLKEEAAEIVKEFAGDVDADMDVRDLERALQDDDGVTDRIHETAESSVIYTADAEMICMVSSNDGAYEDETGEVPETVEQKAYFAYETDLQEILFSEWFLEGMLEELREKDGAA